MANCFARPENTGKYSSSGARVTRLDNGTPTLPPTEPEVASDAPPTEPSVWRHALPWLAGYAALRLVLAVVRLPADVDRLVVLLASLVVSAAVILVASAALNAVARRPLRGGEI